MQAESGQKSVCILGFLSTSTCLLYAIIQQLPSLRRDQSLNSVHGELRFSPLEMDIPPNAASTGGRLTGDVMSNYMESFATKFLKGRFIYKTEVLSIKRGENNSGWMVKVKDSTTDVISDYHFSKVVLCTGVSNCHKNQFHGASS